jgi:hypothetical protein
MGMFLQFLLDLEMGDFVADLPENRSMTSSGHAAPTIGLGDSAKA